MLYYNKIKVMEKNDLSSVTLIKDPSIEPYFIGRDANSYTIYETVYPGTNTKGRGRKTRTKEAVKAVSFHTNFGAAFLQCSSKIIALTCQNISALVILLKDQIIL